MKEKLVTIIVPMYNTGKYMKRCLESILKQQYKEWEVLIVDDGSTDDSRKRVENIIFSLQTEIQKRIKLINIEHGGAGYARNKGIEQAKGEFICFIDSDDYVSESYLLNMVKAIGENDIAICGKNMIWDNKCEAKGPDKTRFIDKYTLLHDLLYKKNNSYLAVCKLYRTEKLRKKQILFPEQMRYEDMVFSFRTCLSLDSFVYVKDISYTYCIREGSQSELLDAETFIDYCRAIYLVLNEIGEKCNIDNIRDDVYFYLLEAQSLIIKLYLLDLTNQKAFQECARVLQKQIKITKKSKTFKDDIENINSEIQML